MIQSNVIHQGTDNLDKVLVHGLLIIITTIVSVIIIVTTTSIMIIVTTTTTTTTTTIVITTGVCKINARSKDTRYDSQPPSPQGSMLTKSNVEWIGLQNKHPIT